MLFLAYLRTKIAKIIIRTNDLLLKICYSKRFSRFDMSLTMYDIYEKGGTILMAPPFS